MYYHKLKPGHTFAEARAVENEFKKLHQTQANEGFILGWYMLALEMTTNPGKEFDYVTIKVMSNPAYFDNSYPQKYFTAVMGADYQTKLTDLYKRMGEVKEVVKTEIWENLESASAAATVLPTPDKFPVWLNTTYKAKEGQYDEYMNRVKKQKAYSQERINSGDGVTWNFSGLMLPWSAEKAYDFSSIITFPTMQSLLTSYGNSGEAAFKKTMPGVDMKQYYKELEAMRTVARQEVYYLLEYAVRNPAETAKK